jgi:hypothetical protein
MKMGEYRSLIPSTRLSKIFLKNSHVSIIKSTAIIFYLIIIPIQLLIMFLIVKAGKTRFEPMNLKRYEPCELPDCSPLCYEKLI